MTSVFSIGDSGDGPSSHLVVIVQFIIRFNVGPPTDLPLLTLASVRSNNDDVGPDNVTTTDTPPTIDHALLSRPLFLLS